MTMRIALISDIHANFEALSVLSEVIHEADRVFFLGDLVGYYCQVNEVIDYIRGLEAVCVLGNHDQFLLAGCPLGVPDAVRFGIEHAARVIEPGHLRWLSGLPLLWGGDVGRRTFLLCHGSPWSPLEDYLYDDNSKLEDLSRFRFDVIAFGQTHRPLLRRTDKGLLLNPGSVGQSRHAAAVACMGLFDTERSQPEMVERPYDPTAVIALARKQGAGPWITKHLCHGLSV